MCSIPVTSIEYSYRIGSIGFGRKRPEMAYEATLIVQLQHISFSIRELCTPATYLELWAGRHAEACIQV